MKLLKAPAPHVFDDLSVTRVMATVALALIPGLLIQLFTFGWGVLFNLIQAVFWALLGEAFALRLRKRSIRVRLADGSAVVTGLLLGLALPPLAPWWLVCIATLFAIIVAKHLYGGIGSNPFNPAMAGYVLVLIAFPLSMSQWLPVSNLQPHPLGPLDALSVIFTDHTLDGIDRINLRMGVDGFTLATPLDTVKTDLNAGFMLREIVSKPIFSGGLGLGWTWVNAGYLLGGLLLLWRRIIQWYVPVGMLGSLAVLALFFHIYSPDQFAAPLFHLFSGATMLGAFFIATDPVSCASSPKGRILFGIGVGTLTYLIRTWGGYPDGVAFAVLLMNLTAPTLDHYTRPRAYGEVKAGG